MQHYILILPYVAIGRCQNVQGNIKGLLAYQQKDALDMDAFVVQLVLENCTCTEVADLANLLEFVTDLM